MAEASLNLSAPQFCTKSSPSVSVSTPASVSEVHSHPSSHHKIPQIPAASKRPAPAVTARPATLAWKWGCRFHNRLPTPRPRHPSPVARGLKPTSRTSPGSGSSTPQPQRRPSRFLPKRPARRGAGRFPATNPRAAAAPEGGKSVVLGARGGAPGSVTARVRSERALPLRPLSVRTPHKHPQNSVCRDRGWSGPRAPGSLGSHQAASRVRAVHVAHPGHI